MDVDCEHGSTLSVAYSLVLMIMNRELPYILI
jgi:hypothetical protein